MQNNNGGDLLCDRRDYHGCFDQLSPLIGLTFCGTVNFPWDPVAAKAAFYPFNGPSKLSLTIENEDVSSYHFRASYNTKGELISVLIIAIKCD
jgi:hypothetical protein